MARTRRMLSPIHSKKHIIPQAVAATAVGAIRVHKIATAVDAPVNTNQDEVEVGSVLKAIYIEMWIRGDDETAPPANVQVSFEKVEGTGVDMVFSNGALLNTYANKAKVFYVTQGLVSAGTANSAIPVLRGWFKIPKGFQRMALGDRLNLNVIAFNHDLESCGIFIYKEYQ